MVDLGFFAGIRIAIFVISFKQFENLLVLELTHLSLEFLPFHVLAVDQIMDFLENFPCLFLGDL